MKCLLLAQLLLAHQLTVRLLLAHQLVMQTLPLLPMVQLHY